MAPSPYIVCWHQEGLFWDDWDPGRKVETKIFSHDLSTGLLGGHVKNYLIILCEARPSTA